MERRCPYVLLAVRATKLSLPVTYVHSEKQFHRGIGRRPGTTRPVPAWRGAARCRLFLLLAWRQCNLNACPINNGTDINARCARSDLLRKLGAVSRAGPPRVLDNHSSN